MEKPSPQTVTAEIFELYDRYGQAEYGESLTQLEHMAQSAELAEQEGYEDEIVLAAFFHDIGHFLEEEATERMGELGAKQHDKLGGDYLRERGFSERMARLVESHVEAKRYLTFRKPDYYETLSDASKQTLKFQGGPMQEAEAEAFERDALFELKVKMRHWDDEAKVTGRPVENMSRYRRMCLDYLRQAK